MLLTPCPCQERHYTHSAPLLLVRCRLLKPVGMITVKKVEAARSPTTTPDAQHTPSNGGLIAASVDTRRVL